MSPSVFIEFFNKLDKIVPKNLASLHYCVLLNFVWPHIKLYLKLNLLSTKTWHSVPLYLIMTIRKRVRIKWILPGNKHLQMCYVTVINYPIFIYTSSFHTLLLTYINTAYLKRLYFSNRSTILQNTIYIVYTIVCGLYIRLLKV